MASKKLIGSRMVMNRDLPRPSSTTSLRDDPGSKKGWTGSSSYVHELERQVKLLKLENAQLEQKLDEKTLLLEQLASESSGESFDPRRIYLLKSQIVQLERQLHLFATSFQRQATLMVKMDNFLTDLVEKQRSSSDTVLKEVRQSAEAIIHSMQTGDEVGVSAERLAQPLYFPNAFQHPKRNQPITFLDICGPSLDHINLKQVAYLESSLASLHRKLISLKLGLSTVPPSVSFLTPIESHGLRQFDDVITTLEQCCTDLLNLSLLIPTAPWALPKTQSFTTAKDIEELLPSFPKRKQEVNKVLDAVVKTFDHRHSVAEMELDVLKVELDFHQSVYKLQLDYVKSLFESIKAGFVDFQSSVTKLVCDPLNKILTSFEKLSKSGSDESLRRFLSQMNENSTKLSDVIDALSSSEPRGGEALSEYGQHFLKKIKSMQRECKREKEERIEKLHHAQSQHEKQEEDFKVLPRQQKTKQPKIRNFGQAKEKPVWDSKF